ncbi:MAG: MFS transporter [Candidatus Hodarchaeales archaeon]
MQIHRNILTLIITHFLWGFVNFTYTIQIQPYLLSFYGTNPESAGIVGLILSLGSLTAVIPLLFSFYAEKWGRRNFIVLGQFLSLIGLVCLAFLTNSIFFAFIGILLYNIGIGFYDPPLQGIIHETARTNRGLSYSLVYNSLSLSGIFASFIIQQLGDQWIIPLLQASCLILMTSVFVNVFSLNDILPKETTVHFPIKKLFKNPLTKWIALVFFFDSLIWGLAMSIENSVIIILFGVESNYLGLILFVQMIITVILQYPIGILVDKFGKIFGLIVGEASGLTWVFFFFLAMINPSEFYILILLAHASLGLSVAFWRPSVTLSFVTIEEENASTNFGILSFFQRIGWVPTAALGGLIFANFGYSVILALTFFGTLILVIFFLKINSLEKAIKSKKL